MMEHTAKLIEAIKKDGRFRGVHLMLKGKKKRSGNYLSSEIQELGLKNVKHSF